METHSLPVRLHAEPECLSVEKRGKFSICFNYNQEILELLWDKYEYLTCANILHISRNFKVHDLDVDMMACSLALKYQEIFQPFSFQCQNIGKMY